MRTMPTAAHASSGSEASRTRRVVRRECTRERACSECSIPAISPAHSAMSVVGVAAGFAWRRAATAEASGSSRSVGCGGRRMRSCASTIPRSARVPRAASNARRGPASRYPSSPGESSRYMSSASTPTVGEAALSTAVRSRWEAR